MCVKVAGKATDAKYSTAQMNFALKLFEKPLNKKAKKIFLSPLFPLRLRLQ